MSLASVLWWRSGSVVECLTRDLGAADSRLTSLSTLCPCARHIHPYLVLVQPRKTRPYITERQLTWLTGRKESNLTYKTRVSVKVHKVLLGVTAIKTVSGFVTCD